MYQHAIHQKLLKISASIVGVRGCVFVCMVVYGVFLSDWAACYVIRPECFLKY